MREVPYVDPLGMASELLACIVNGETPRLGKLAASIDAFVYSLRFLLVDSVAFVQQADDAPTPIPGNGRRELIATRFPELGFYWVTLDSRIVPGMDCETAIGDAIDDLDDIAKELIEVAWNLDHHGRDEALAALRWRYENHLWMHVLPLRAHLEELVRSLKGAA